MNIKKTFYYLFVISLLGLLTGHAQILGPYGTSPTTVEVDANGLLTVTGTYGTGSLSLSGAGTEMFWYPGKAAFRAGNVSGSNWNDTNIGAYSAAFGQDTKASAANSFAAGNYSSASGPYSFAAGASTSASGICSFAMGLTAYATGPESVALGSTLSASGTCSVALGYTTTASGNYSVALGGSYTDATGLTSLATGSNTTASGNESASFNSNTSAASYCSTAFGQFNVGLSSSGTTPSTTTWVATDPLFEIGNSTTYSAKSDALVVYKNGNATVQGVLAAHTAMRCAPSGDLGMGSFTAGTAP